MQRGAHRAVGGNAACHRKGGVVRGLRQINLERAAGFFGKHIDNGALESGTKIAPILLRDAALCRRQCVARPQNGCFQSGKRKVTARPVEQRAWQAEAFCLPAHSLAFDSGATGLRQAQKTGHLVERLAGGVVDGAAKPAVIFDTAHQQKLAMPAGYQQHEIGEFQPVGQPRRQGVPCQMVDANQRKPCCGGQSLGHHHAGQNAADQARPCRYRNAVNVTQRHARLRQRLFDAVVKPFCVGPSRNFRDNAAEIGVECRLPFDHGRQDVTGICVLPDNSRGRVVTTAFDPKEGERFHLVRLSEARVAGNTAGMVRQSRPNPAILLTRPLGRNERFAQDLGAVFGPLTIVQSPLLAITYLSPDLPDEGITSLIFTSEAGVQGYRRLASSRPVVRRAWCVGARTAEAAQAIGLDAVAAGGNARTLCDAIIAAQEGGSYLHLHGRDTRGDVAATLQARGIVARSCTVYVQEAQPLNSDAVALLSGEGPVVAPVFSPRTAALLCGERARLSLPAPLWFIALSGDVAAGLALQAGDRIVISETPDSLALIAAAGTFLTASA